MLVPHDHPRAGRVLIALGSFVLVGVVGYVDGRSSAYIAFSIFYLVPVFLAAWFVNRATGIAVAIACASAGVAADLLSLGAQPVYVYANFGLRLLLFVSAALLIDRVHRSIIREQRLAEREREAAERLALASRLQAELMRSVARDAWEPLADIHARVVGLHFDSANGPDPHVREVLGEIAEASVKVSALVNTLLEETPGAPRTELTPVGPVEATGASGDLGDLGPATDRLSVGRSG